MKRPPASELAGAPANLRQIRRFIADHRDRLLAYPNVRYVAAARKIVNGKPERDYSLTFYVGKKSEAIKPADRIPDHFLTTPDGRTIPTDVVQDARQARAFGLRSGHMIISHDGEVGTVFAPSTVHGQKYLITNAHVLLDVDEPHNLGNVTAIDQNTGQEIVIGHGKAAIPLLTTQINKNDAGLVAINPGIPLDNLMVSGLNVPILTFDYFRTGTNARYFYNVGTNVFECTLPNRVETPVPVIVEGTEVSFSHFWRLDMVNTGNRPGHSGALVYRHVNGGVIACGILFAGAQDEYIYCYSAQKAVNALSPFF
ncbi:MAG: hypothetical protein AAGF28_13095 [Pseudomonadota bacterium]